MIVDLSEAGLVAKTTIKRISANNSITKKSQNNKKKEKEKK